MDSPKFYADLRLSFLESYKKDQYFQMSVQGLGTGTWQMRGRAMPKAPVHLRNARQRVRDILINCHRRLALNPAMDQAFGKYLETKLRVTSVEEPFSGSTHWWTPEDPRGQPSFAAAAAFSGPRTVNVAGPPAAPTWAFNRPSAGPHSCTIGCRCCPPVASSAASPEYSTPPSAYPSVASSFPPFPVRGVRDAAGGGLPGGGLRDSGRGSGGFINAVPVEIGGLPRLVMVAFDCGRGERAPAAVAAVVPDTAALGVDFRRRLEQ